ncbi:hypothetical protein OC834_001476 [Tilletia horrida]|nr:hypothetical protein OC834_001476 [Tilletia horrida]
MDYSTTATGAGVGAGPRLPALGSTALGTILLLEDHLPPPWQEAAALQLPTLLLAHTALAFLASAFRVQPAYAFPLALAGLLVVCSPAFLSAAHAPASTGAHAETATFLIASWTLLFLLSALLDVVWLWRHLGGSSGAETRFLVLLVTTLSLALKPLTLLTLAKVLKDRGALEPATAQPHWAQAQQVRGADFGANGGWLGGGANARVAGGGGGGEGLMPGSWSGSQQQQSSSATGPLRPGLMPRPISTLSTTSSIFPSSSTPQHQQQQHAQSQAGPARTAPASASADRYAYGYQIDSDDDDDDGGRRDHEGARGMDIPRGHHQQPTEADAMPISASFARQAGFTTTATTPQAQQ